MDLKEIGINMKNWVNSAHGKYYCKALVNSASNHRVPQLVSYIRFKAYNFELVLRDKTLFGTQKGEEFSPSVRDRCQTSIMWNLGSY